MAQGKEANDDKLEIFFLSSIQELYVECTH